MEATRTNYAVPLRRINDTVERKVHADFAGKLP